MKNSLGMKKIYITESDMDRLEELLSVAVRHSARDFHHLENLTKELMKAEIVKPIDVPSSVVTMNSKVLLKDLERNEQKTYVLVFPKEANVDQNKISVLSPIGTAVLGCCVGHVLKVKTPAGERRMKVEKILYQPEKAGDFHL
ncbi:MAG: nucleoside diphosphate kinase regulator [Geobacteraceae bacterium]